MDSVMQFRRRRFHRYAQGIAVMATHASGQNQHPMRVADPRNNSGRRRLVAILLSYAAGRHVKWDCLAVGASLTHVSLDGVELLRIAALRVEFPTTDRRYLTAVDGVDLNVQGGEVLGLIGESGCGKSVTARAAMGLIDPPARVSGSLSWAGCDVTCFSERQWRDIRGSGVAMLFQKAQVNQRLGPFSLPRAHIQM